MIAPLPVSCVNLVLVRLFMLGTSVTRRQLVAVFYVKTNQPQSLMQLETQSFYGRTVGFILHYIERG